jgi:hypothetical protein
MNDHSQQQKILTVNILLCQLFYIFRPPWSGKARILKKEPAQVAHNLQFYVRFHNFFIAANLSLLLELILSPH